MWASVEVDGLHRSSDGGDTWTSLGALGGEAFYNDVHGLETVVTRSGRDLLVTTPFGLGRSIDQGETFDWHAVGAFVESKLGVACSRCVRAPWDDVIVVCVGDYVPGRVGALEISRVWWLDVAACRSPGRTQLDDVLAGHAPRAPRHDRRLLTVRPGVRVRRPRRHVAQARSRFGEIRGLRAHPPQPDHHSVGGPPIRSMSSAATARPNVCRCGRRHSSGDATQRKYGITQELLVDFITSLDGYASGKGWPGFWGLEGPEYLAWLGEQPDVTYLMGANTYRLMSGFAAGELPAGTDEFTADEQESVDGLTRAPKVVFSASLDGPLTRANSTLVRDDAVDTVRAMKEDGSGLLSTIGSLSLSRSLLRAGLVDRFLLRCSR